MKFLKYGMGASALLILFFTIVYSLEWYKSFRQGAINILEMVVVILAVYLYLREIKKTVHPEGISFWKAVVEGMKVIIIISFISSAYSYFYFSNNEEVYSRFKNYTFDTQIEVAKKANFPEEEINRYIQTMKSESYPFNFARNYFISINLSGLVFVLILAAITRKKETSYKAFDDSELRNN